MAGIVVLDCRRSEDGNQQTPSPPRVESHPGPNHASLTTRHGKGDGSAIAITGKAMAISGAIPACGSASAITRPTMRTTQRSTTTARHHDPAWLRSPMSSARRSTDGDVWRCPAESPHGPLSNSQVSRSASAWRCYRTQWRAALSQRVA